MIVSHCIWLENSENYLSVLRSGDIIGKFSIIFIIFFTETPSGIGSKDSGIYFLWSVILSIERQNHIDMLLKELFLYGCNYIILICF